MGSILTEKDHGLINYSIALRAEAMMACGLASVRGHSLNYSINWARA